MDINKIIEYLVKISEAKLSLMGRILEITKKQSHCTNEEKIEELMLLIDQKQDQINRVNVLDKEFAEKYDLLKKGSSISSLEELDPKEYMQLGELKRIVNKIINTAEEIRVYDDNNKEQINQIFELVKDELNKARNGIKLHNIYNKKVAIYDGVFIDKKK